MFSLKNNKIKKQPKLKLCKIHNDKNPKKTIAKMFTRKSSVSVKDFCFLKNKKPKKQISYKNNGIVSKRYSSILVKKIKREWVHEIKVINWLEEIGIKVKQLSSESYSVNNRLCTFTQLLVFANRKRVNMGLNPFCVAGKTED